MARQLTADDARQSLTAHVEGKGLEIYAQYGPVITWAALLRLLTDRTQVRYPCELVFEAGSLRPGEFALPEQKGETPEEGFRMCVHPFFLTQLDRVPALVLYQLVAVNYGEFASAHDAETFGATSLGMTRDEYYDLLCDASDQLGGDLEAASGGCEPGGGGGCHCGG